MNLLCVLEMFWENDGKNVIGADMKVFCFRKRKKKKA